MIETLTIVQFFCLFVGGLLVAGLGATLLMFAFSQTSARIAIWFNLIRAFHDRKRLLIEVQQLRQDLDTMRAMVTDDAGKQDGGPNELVTTIKVNEPTGDAK